MFELLSGYMSEAWQWVWGHTVYKTLERLGGRGYFIGQTWTDVCKIFTEFVGDFFCAGNAFTIFIYQRVCQFLLFVLAYCIIQNPPRLSQWQKGSVVTSHATSDFKTFQLHNYGCFIFSARENVYRGERIDWSHHWALRQLADRETFGVVRKWGY